MFGFAAAMLWLAVVRVDLVASVDRWRRRSASRRSSSGTPGCCSTPSVRAERGVCTSAAWTASTGAGWAADPTARRFGVDHPFAHDLDLFGDASVFQLYDTARTEIGEETLADWLRAPAAAAEVLARQQAVAELRSMPEFREDVAVLAAEADVARTGALAAWASGPPVDFAAWVAPMFILFAAIALGLSAAVLAGRSNGAGLPPSCCCIARLHWHGARRLPARCTASARLSATSAWCRRCSSVSSVSRSRPRGSPRCAARSLTEGVPPSRRIAALRRLISWRDPKRNLMFRPISAALLWRQHSCRGDRPLARAYGGAVVVVARRRRRARSAVCACDLRVRASRRPVSRSSSTRRRSSKPTALGHPLIAGACGGAATTSRSAASIRTCSIVSGSNMSGKSTLLRAVGVNVVLALAGAPVRAARLRLSPLAIGATLRVDDSLQAGHSRFYAEILRIRAIVERAARGRAAAVPARRDPARHQLPRSPDRRRGHRARAGRAGAIGLVTTHDLALAELAATLGSRAVNVHFEDRIENGRMVFDYRMRPGVVERSNALELMRAVGLEV